MTSLRILWLNYSGYTLLLFSLGLHLTYAQGHYFNAALALTVATLALMITSHWQHPRHLSAGDRHPEVRQSSILLVEDYEPNVLIATIMLEHFGYDYAVARNGEEGLASFSAGHYKVLLMDLEMPVMDGFTLTQQIRSLEGQRGSQPAIIIAMTAHAMKDTHAQCLHAGMDDYITKPFTPLQLHGVLSRYLPDIT